MALTLEESTSANSKDRQVLSQRRDAVIARMPPLLRRKVTKLSRPVFARISSARLRLQLSEAPDVLYINGVRAAPSDTQRELRLWLGFIRFASIPSFPPRSS
jgi:hypothetical protein